jgi:CheY-like chemotaxis protein
MVPHRTRPLLLAVDDDHPHCYVIARLGQKAGYEVRQAFTGRSALQQAKVIPEVVVLDVHLPDIDGYEVCRRLKDDPATSAIPVVFVSATVEIEQGVRQAAALGAMTFLSDVQASAVLPALLSHLARPKSH